MSLTKICSKCAKPTIPDMKNYKPTGGCEFKKHFEYTNEKGEKKKVKIGEGNFGKVMFVHEKMVTNRKPHDLVVKEQEFFDDRWKEALLEGFKTCIMSEQKLGPQYHGLYICKINTKYYTKYISFIVLDRFDGDIKQLSIDNPSINLANIIYQPLLDKIQRMHNIKYKDNLGFTRIMIHADIAPKNILYKKTLEAKSVFTICLADFGLDVYDKDIKVRIKYFGTLLQYMWIVNEFHFPRVKDFPELIQETEFWDLTEKQNYGNIKKYIDNDEIIWEYTDLLERVEIIFEEHNDKNYTDEDTYDACRLLIRMCVENPRILDYFYLQTLQDKINGNGRHISDTYVFKLISKSKKDKESQKQVREGAQDGE